VDSIVRLIPGVISDITSALDDSFQDDLISYPVYTKPRQYKTWKVPEILLSGDKKKISEWLLEKSIERTRKYKMTKKYS
jgi:tRNA (guanine37-N1)-methyltransferase